MLVSSSRGCRRSLDMRAVSRILYPAPASTQRHKQLLRRTDWLNPHLEGVLLYVHWRRLEKRRVALQLVVPFVLAVPPVHITENMTDANDTNGQWQQ